MARKTVSVRRNSDGTWTIRAGRYTEHISTEGKTHGEIFDSVKYACMTANVYLPDTAIVELMTRAR